MWLKNNRDFTKQFLQISIPVVIQQLLANMLQIFDTMMVSGISDTAISGVSVGNKFFFIYNLMLFGLTNGIGLFIAQYYGIKDKAGYNQIFRFGLAMCVGSALVCTLFLLAFPEVTVTVFVKNPVIIRHGLEYVLLVRYSYLPFAVSMMCGVICRVKGNAQAPMTCGAVAFVVNIVGNYLLIFGHFGFPKLGVAGAAIATLLSRVIEMLLMLLIINHPDSDVKLTLRYPLLDLKQAKTIIRKTLPLIGNEILWSLALSAIFLNYCYVSEYYIPALTIVDTISSLIYTVFAGCATATGIIVGKSLGANQLVQAKADARRMIKIGTTICIFGSLLVFLISPLIPNLFSLSGELARMTMLLLMIKCGITWSQGYAETIYYVLRAGGDTKGVLIIDGLFTCFGPLLLSTMCARVWHMDLLWMFIITEGIYLIKIFISSYFYKKEKWLISLTTGQEGGKA